ncbi:50S ribosomal protein L23 [Anaerolineae bacterium]|nr:50S ribosomal protein L23 [Chloroflexota bacterium]GBL36885.1 50S ribosomal protein L23 [Anaerolineaceae bacterium]GDX67837.1 50S ribosomal protein L23 [Anaerolineae bacterium]
MALTAYDVLRRPLITEKTNFHVNKLHQYVFEVASAATKVQVKEAVEKLFRVSVASVNTMVVPAKRARRMRRFTTRKPASKKAIVTLVEGDTIPDFEGVR